MKSEIARPVKARRVGSEGLMPIEKFACPYRGTVFCISPGGGSYCGGYGGDAPIRGTQLHSVRCLEEHNADFVLQNWSKLPRRAAHTQIHR